ncbi:MAG: hypothetical protein Q7S73_01515 [bacterium]|nr:hypothetical protein [bacterium]
MDDLNPQPSSFPPPPGGRPTMPLPPPPPEITLRTMKSDLESLKETGGSGPAPKPFTPPELKKEWSAPTTPPPPPPKITPADFGSPRENLKAEMEKEMAPVIEEEPAASGRGKKLLLWGGVVVVAVGVGLLSYFVLFPMLFPTQTPPPPPAVTPPTTTETPEVPVATTENEGRIHQSLLQSSDSAVEVNLASSDLTSLTNALNQEAQKSNPSGNLIEVSLSDANGPLDASKFLSAVFPELSMDNIKSLFGEDFTTGLFYDQDGVWPAYILKLAPNANLADGQTFSTILETSTNLQNLFLTSPGTPSASGFKTGQLNGLSTRYLTYSKKGAGLNIVWSGDKLVLSTSYNGLKKVLSSLVP